MPGLAVGSSSLIVPQYISECSPPAIRGRLVGLFEVVLQCALVIGFWVNYGVNQHIPKTSSAQWQIPFGLQFIFGTLLILLMLLQPESPRWLMKAGRTDQALQVLSHIRNMPADDEYIQWEMDTIREQLQREDEQGANGSLVKKLAETFKAGNRNRLFMGMALMMLQNFSGINALNYFSPAIFKSIGFSGTSVSLLATGVFGLVKCFATLAFMLFGVDRLGRRNSMLIGSCGAIVAMFYLGSFAKVTGSFHSTAPKSAASYVAIVMIYIYAVFYAMSWNGIPWIFWLVQSPYILIASFVDFDQLRGFSDCHSLCLSGIHYLHPVAWTIHHCLFDSVYDQKHYIWYLLPVWYICCDWRCGRSLLYARDKGSLA